MKLALRTWPLAAVVVAVLALPQAALAEIKVGVTIAATGSAAALGGPARNTFTELFPKEIAGEKITVIVLDDASDPGNATTNARRLVTEDRVDVLVGSSITPSSMAVAGVALENGVPHFTQSPIGLPPERGKWTFMMPQPVSLMAKAAFDHMKANKATSVGFIGFSDSWGDLWVKEFKAQAEPMGLKMVAEERYARADTSVAGQTLKLVAAKPDVVLVAASGTGAALPQIALRERGFTGIIYHTHGAVTKDFIRIAGKSAEGAILPSGPLVVAELLPPSPQTNAAVEHLKAYEAKYGAGSITQFSGHAYDVGQILKRVVPVALKTAKPGSKDFRDALLAAIESEKEIAASHGVYNFTPTDHSGLDERGRVLLTVKDGTWALVK
ncbi:MAG TPA: ABC transporter substrate-binding protein [Hyphomicrobiaceae bacterium]|jgi:branched-chain amino acid transport system substrate-binding protein|nr:ABC transporter substrate-binding protein [Hyphomicrobiaceae bacterium]